MEKDVNDPIALHVLVVGFHHKKGMQVEYSYPPLGPEDNPFELDEKWKHLPSLCLPDGAHNHEADTVYFHLPHLIYDNQTVFGVSCYRQIDAEKVANKTADITRNTVQKSVCVITTLPIYGYVQERLKATTKVYFKEADFSDVRDLEGLYHDLNNTNWKDRLMHGICVSEAVKIFGRNTLLLFKLLLLERKVLFFNGQVASLGKTITSLLALLPANLPQGLTQAAASKYSQLKSYEEFSKRLNGIQVPVLEELGALKSNECDITQVKEFSGKVESVLSTTCEGIELATEQREMTSVEDSTVNGDLNKQMNHTEEKVVTESATEAIMSGSEDMSDRRSSVSSLTSVTSRGSIMSGFQSLHSPDSSQPNLATKFSSIKGRLSGAINYWTGKEKVPVEKPSATTTPNPSPIEACKDMLPPLGESLPEDGIIVDTKTDSHQPLINTEVYASIEPDQCGLPLQIFTKGNLLHPYLSLQYIELLTSPSTRAFVAGASNALFIHKKNLAEVIIQLEDGKIEILDPELKKQLNLSTEDLRFAENLVRQVESVNASSCPESPLADVFLDGVGWMGGEEWLRLQFKVYLLAMLRSSLCPETSREYEVFNGSFMSAWLETHNYRMWLGGGPYEAFTDLIPGHPNAGNISITDMRIRLSHSMGLERSRRLNQTLANTGTAVVKTKEAVGGAITSAKGALTNLWSSFTTPSDKDAIEQAQEATPDEDKENPLHALEEEEVNNPEMEELSQASEIEMAAIP